MGTRSRRSAELVVAPRLIDRIREARGTAEAARRDADRERFEAMLRALPDLLVAHAAECDAPHYRLFLAPHAYPGIPAEWRAETWTGRYAQSEWDGLFSRSAHLLRAWASGQGLDIRVESVPPCGCMITLSWEP